MAKPPVPLDPSNQVRYDDLYNLFGKAEADAYALSIAKSAVGNKATAPVTPTIATVPPSSASGTLPNGGLPVTITLPQKATAVTGVPVGMEPRMAPPPMRDIVIKMPSGETLAEQGRKAGAMYKERRVKELMAQGLTREEGLRRADEEEYKVSTAPRTTEFGARAVSTKPAGYSELAVRGEELLPKMSKTEALGQAILPQVLETETQAEGRRRFDAAKVAAKAEVERVAKQKGYYVSVPDPRAPGGSRQEIDIERVKREAEISNSLKADDIIKQMYPGGQIPGGYVEKKSDVIAALNAPLYAAIDEYKGVPPDVVLSRWGKDVLRGLTTEEKQGRLVETRGAAALRNLGGISRFMVRGAEEGLVRPAMKGLVAATTPATYADLTEQEEMVRAAAGGAAKVPGVPGMKLDKGFEARRKLDTGDFVKDVAFEIATGRSAMDDWYDTGIGTGAATALGLATEFFLPQTPIGVVTDVAPAFKAVGMARKVGEIPGAAALGGKVAGLPLPNPVPFAVDLVGSTRAAKAVGRAAELVSDIPQVARLRAVAKGIRSTENFGEALNNSEVFRGRLADGASVRTNLVESVAREGADIGQIRKTLLNAKNAEGTGTRIGEEIVRGRGAALQAIESVALESGSAGGVFSRKIIAKMDDARAEYAAARTPEARAEVVNRTFNDILQFSEDAFESGIKSPSQLTRTSVAAGDLLPDALVSTGARDINPVRQKVLAEAIDVVPTDNYFFLTSRLLVNKKLLENPEFRKAVLEVTKRPELVKAGRAEIERAIESAIKERFTGVEDLAEASSAAIPRTASEEGIFDFARGGLERLQKPEGRRLRTAESYRDTIDTVKAVGGSWFKNNGTLRFGVDPNKFANVGYAKGGGVGRVPVDVADFMRGAKSGLDNVPGRLYAAVGTMARNGVDDVLDAYASARILEDAALGNRGIFDTDFVNGVRDVQQIDNVEALNTATTDAVRLFFGSENLTYAFGSDASSIVKRAIENAAGTTLREKLVNAVADIRNIPAAKGKLDQAGMVRMFGGGKNGILFGDDIDAAITQLIMSREAKAIFRENVKKHIPVWGTDQQFYDRSLSFGTEGLTPKRVGGVDVTGQAQDAVLRFLNDNPQVGEKLRRVADYAAEEFMYGNPFREFTAEHVSGFADLKSAVKAELEGVVGASAASIRRAHREAVATRSARIAREREAARAEIETIRRNMQIDLREAASGRSSIITDTDEIRAQADSAIMRAENARDARIDAIDDEIRELEDAALVEERTGSDRMRDIRAEVEEVANNVVSEFIYHGIRPRVEDLGTRFNMARASAGWQDHVTAQMLSETVNIPMPTPLAADIRKYFGSLDDLKRMEGVIGQNVIDTVRLSPLSTVEGMGQRFKMILGEALETGKSLTASGLTAGTLLPNTRYHAVNFQTAPLVQAFTSPQFIMETLGSRLAGALPAGVVARFDVPDASTVRAFRDTPDKVMFTTPQGVQYTSGQLNKMLDETFFGMSANTLTLSERMLDDIIINSKAPIPGISKVVPTFNQTALEGLRYLNVRGTNPWVRGANKVDRAWRETAYITGLRNGLTHEQAIEIARNAFLDYGKIPPALKTQAGKYMMFASWMIMNNAELLRAFLNPNSAANIIKLFKAQRAVQQYAGDWIYSDDATKKRLWSKFIGDFDGLPAYEVGPENPAVGPMIDNIGPATLQLYQMGYDAMSGESPFSSTATLSDGVNWFVKSAFSPGYQYLKDIGALGNAAMGDVVPAKSIAAAQLRGPGYFRTWMDENGIQPIPYDKRRPGEPTFNGEQYMFVSDKAKEKWARSELLNTFAGIQRLADDWKSLQLYLGNTPPGMDAKRFSGTDSIDALQYMFALETRQKGKSEYDAVMRAMNQARRELESGEVSRAPATED